MPYHSNLLYFPLLAENFFALCSTQRAKGWGQGWHALFPLFLFSGCSLNVPITQGRLNLGTWQGLWLWWVLREFGVSVLKCLRRLFESSRHGVDNQRKLMWRTETWMWCHVTVRPLITAQLFAHANWCAHQSTYKYHAWKYVLKFNSCNLSLRFNYTTSSQKIFKAYEPTLTWLGGKAELINWLLYEQVPATPFLNKQKSFLLTHHLRTLASNNYFQVHTFVHYQKGP